MRISINPKYSSISTFIKEIPTMFDKPDFGRVMHQGRNIVKNIDNEYVIKKFIKITLSNRIIYSFFRKTKAQRSFEITRELKKYDIDAPEEIAYIDIKEGSFLKNCYYIYHFSPYQTLDICIGGDYDEKCKSLIKEFADFVANLHLKRIVHHDLNITNILCNRKDGKTHFQLIDINRVRFKGKPVSEKKYIRNFSRLDVNSVWYDDFIMEYARIMGLDPMILQKKCHAYADRKKVYVRARHFLKDIILLRFLRSKKSKNNDIEAAQSDSSADLR